jgi:hypothetical protein
MNSSEKKFGFEAPSILKFGAAKGARTLDIHLGKVAFYQLNYRRASSNTTKKLKWAEEDLNLHGFPHMLLRHARLPFRHPPIFPKKI